MIKTVWAKWVLTTQATTTTNIVWIINYIEEEWYMIKPNTWSKCFEIRDLTWRLGIWPGLSHMVSEQTLESLIRQVTRGGDTKAGGTIPQWQESRGAYAYKLN